MTDRHLSLVFSNPVQGKEDEFNAWYDDVHVPEVLRTEGYVCATRYKICPRQANMGPLESPASPDARSLPDLPPQLYLAMWEMEGDLNHVFTRFRDRFIGGEIHMRNVFTDIRSWTFTALGPPARPDGTASSNS